VGKRVKKCVGHDGVVNCVAAASAKGPYIFASGGDDGALRLWDYRTRTSFQDLSHKYQVKDRDHLLVVVVVVVVGVAMYH